MFLYKYNEGKKEIRKKPDGVKHTNYSRGDPAKKSAQRAEYGGQTNGSI